MNDRACTVPRPSPSSSVVKDSTSNVSTSRCSLGMLASGSGFRAHRVLAARRRGGTILVSGGRAGAPVAPPRGAARSGARSAAALALAVLALAGCEHPTGPQAVLHPE